MTHATEVWSVVEVLDGRPHDTAAKIASEAARLARLLDARPCCVVADPLAEETATLGALADHGVSRVYVRGGADAVPDSVSSEVAVERLVTLVGEHRPEVVLFAGTREGGERAARLAARLRLGLIAGCVDFEIDDDELSARRPVSGGSAHARLRWRHGAPRIATVDLGSLEAVAASPSAAAEVIRVTADSASAPRAVHRRRWRLSADELDLTEAAFIIGVGRPVDTAESFERVQQLADRLGASLGGSRIAHFQGIVPKSRQIGASGKWIAPEVYLTLGISGASYHLMGIKGAKHVIAVNSDRDAPIFKLAEVGILADLGAVVEALLDLLDGPAHPDAPIEAVSR